MNGLSLEGYRKFWKDKMTEKKKQEHFERFINPASNSHKAIDKSKVYGSEYLDLEDRGQLKYLQEEKRITSTGHLKDL